MIEHPPGIQKQDRLFLLPNGFYRQRASGQTARIVLASGMNRLEGPPYRTGVKDRDALAVPGKRGNREKGAQQKRH